MGVIATPEADGIPHTMDVHSYIACAPRGAGVALAMFYLVAGKSVRGWFAREHDARSASAYFALEPSHPAGAMLFCRSVDDDPHGKWIGHTLPVTTGIRCPLSDSECRELARRRAAFGLEWLFSPDDPRDRDEVESYRKLGLPTRPLNVRSAQFGRFDRNRAVWVHASAGIDLELVLCLKERLPADRRDAILPT